MGQSISKIGGNTLADIKFREQVKKLDSKVDLFDSQIKEITTKKIYQFDSVASMKAYNLKVGEVCETLGYYKPNDGGGAKYYIRDKFENEVADDGSTHYIGNNIIAELVVDHYIDVKVFGAKGDSVTDDTKCIQNLVNYCVSNKKEMYVSNGTYMLTSPININGAISIFGNGNNGLSKYLAGASSVFIINHEGIGFNILPSSYYFKRTVLNGFCIRCHDNFKTNTNMVGLFVSNICHVLLEKMSVQEFRSGVGIRMGSNDTNAKFQGQYSSISRCLLGYNLINIEVNKYNGINIVNNVIDGNNNGSDLNNYENGFPPGSYGIKVNSGDSCMIINNIIQGHQFGIYSNACQIVKLYNEETGKKMFRIFSNIFYIVFMLMWFSSLIYFDYTVIKDYHKDIGLLLFSFIFYIPGFIMVKKVIETIKEGRTL